MYWFITSQVECCEHKVSIVYYIRPKRWAYWPRLDQSPQGVSVPTGNSERHLSFWLHYWTGAHTYNTNLSRKGITRHVAEEAAIIEGMVRSLSETPRIEVGCHVWRCCMRIRMTVGEWKPDSVSLIVGLLAHLVS